VYVEERDPWTGKIHTRKALIVDDADDYQMAPPRRTILREK